MDYEEISLRRRRLLALAGTGATTACLTGCLGSTEGAVGDDEDGEDAGEPVRADLRMEPVEYPDETCAVDARNVRDHPGWNAQILHEDGERAFFCTSGDMGAYYVSPKAFGVSTADVAGVWVTDYDTDETIDGTDAYYVFVADTEAVEMPAGRNPIPFAERERAEEFVDRESLGGSSIERLSKITFNRCTW
ncbi:MAG: nitrous oxide reductase accessory protein NosL [Halobacteriales archaeon]|nr:nitrous oxide reductase accessory protein NosL [Halobacteriales archaeon]